MDTSSAYCYTQVLRQCMGQISSSPHFLNMLCVVLHLVEHYHYQGHRLFIDHYYSSILPAQALQNNTAFTGTCVCDRVDISNLIRGGQTPGEGEVMAFWNDHLMALTWQAKNKAPAVILTCSPECSAQMVTELSTCRHSGVAAQNKPTTVNMHNKTWMMLTSLIST